MTTEYSKKQYKAQLIDPDGVVRCERYYIETHNGGWLKFFAERTEGWSMEVLGRTYTHRSLPKTGESSNEYTKWEKI